MRVIVNADDFGLDEATSKAIAGSFANHWINQTTLMVNMPYADEAVKMAKQLGFADKIGLHLNLTEGRPLTMVMANSRFVGEDGCFNGMKNVRGYLRPYDAATRYALETEIDAQIKKFLSYQLPLMHCDSHHHMHTRIPVTRVLMPLLKTYGFKTLRMCNNVGLGWGVRGVLWRIRNWVFERLVRSSELEMTHYFCSVARARSVEDSIEIMVHPRIGKDGCVLNVTDYSKGTGMPMSAVVATLCKLFSVSAL